MKSWPEVLRARYPLQEGRVATRPWWSGSSDSSRQRVDGRWVMGSRCLEDGSETCWHTRLAGLRVPLDGVTSVNDAMAAVDRLYPLPHPGFRVGQVWALQSGRDVALTGSEGAYWHVGGQWLTAETAKVVLEGAFLVADPACPWLAPWAPAEAP